MAWKHTRGKPHPHKGSHAPRRKGWHISAKARAARIGKKHPHKGSHGHRKFKGRHYHGRKSKGRKPRRITGRHISAVALAARRGKKHPHAGKGKGHPRTPKTARHPGVRKTTTRHVPGKHAGQRAHVGRHKFLNRFRRHSRHNRLRNQAVHRRYAFRNRRTRRRR